MTLDQLKSFMIIAEKGSFSKASHDLYVSPSALTQQMNTLEKHLGFRLFHRISTGVFL